MKIKTLCRALVKRASLNSLSKCRMWPVSWSLILPVYIQMKTQSVEEQDFVNALHFYIELVQMISDVHEIVTSGVTLCQRAQNEQRFSSPEMFWFHSSRPQNVRGLLCVSSMQFYYCILNRLLSHLFPQTQTHLSTLPGTNDIPHLFFFYTCFLVYKEHIQLTLTSKIRSLMKRERDLQFCLILKWQELSSVSYWPITWQVWEPTEIKLY